MRKAIALALGIIALTATQGHGATFVPQLNVTLELYQTGLRQYGGLNFSTEAFDRRTHTFALSNYNCSTGCFGTNSYAGGDARTFAHNADQLANLTVPHIPGVTTREGAIDTLTTSEISFYRPFTDALNIEHYQVMNGPSVLGGNPYRSSDFVRLLPEGETFMETLSDTSWRISAVDAPLGSYSYTERGGVLGLFGGGFEYPEVRVGYEVGAVTFEIVAQVDAPPPTDAELAGLSRAAYGDYPNTGRFTHVGTISTDTDINARVYVDEGLNGGTQQVVVAIEGTNGGVLNMMNNVGFLADNSYLLTENAEIIARHVADLMKDKPNSQVTMTGHSLGGAIAEAIGAAGHVGTVSFNAPGGAGHIDVGQIQNDINRHGQLESARSGVKAYSFYGDQVSRIGEHFGPVTTFIPDNRAIIDVMPLGACAFACHGIEAIHEKLSLRAGETVEGLISPYGDISPGDLVLLSLNGKIFEEEVEISGYLFFDPIGSDGDLVISMHDGSAQIAGFLLPDFDDVFGVYGFDGSDWIFIGQASGFEDFSVPAYAKYLITNGTALFLHTGEFLVGMRFAEAGTFRGEISIVRESGAVPEPATWVMMILGIGTAGSALRHRWRRYAVA